MPEFLGFRFDPTFNLGSIVNLVSFILALFIYEQKKERRWQSIIREIERRVDRYHAENQKHIAVIESRLVDLWTEFMTQKNRGQ